jgi:hypothetical protein
VEDAPIEWGSCYESKHPHSTKDLLDEWGHCTAIITTPPQRRCGLARPISSAYGTRDLRPSLVGVTLHAGGATPLNTPIGPMSTHRLTPEPSFPNIYPGKQSHWIPTARSPGVFLRVRLARGTYSCLVPLRRSFRHTISIADPQRPFGKLCQYHCPYLPRAAVGKPH